MTAIPQTMHCAQMVKFGSPKESILFNEEVPIPQIKKETQILVRVKAAGINPLDAKLASGNFNLLTRYMSLPRIPGTDYSGVIIAKGTKVKGFEIGDKVFGVLSVPYGGKGTFAQYTLVDTKVDGIGKKPDHLSFEQAASSGVALVTAYQGIIVNGNINEKNINNKRNILVIGASGGVGSYGIQIAKSINQENTVIGICSEKNSEFVKSLGADRVINYKDKDAYNSFINEKIPFDIIFDCVGGNEYYKRLDPLLIKTGVYSTAGGPLENVGFSYVTYGTAFSLLGKLMHKMVFAAHPYIFISNLPFKNFGSKFAPLFENDKVKGTVYSDDSIISLKDAAVAFEMISSHRTVGKIVITID